MNGFAGEAAAAQESLAPGAVTEVGGFLGERVLANVKLLLKFDIDRYVRMVEEKKHRDWAPIGEQLGKWLEAATEASQQSQNAPLRTKAEEALKRVIAAQDDDGYLGITDPELRTDRRPLRGMEPYELYFTLHALLSAYQRWGSDDALAAARRLGGYLVEKIGPGKAEFWPVPDNVTIAGHSVHYGLEGALLAHPMTHLHRLCGEREYLDWSQWVVDSIDRWSGCGTLSNLDKVARGQMRLYQIQPNVHARTLHMNLLALLELYQVTGDEGLLRKVRGAWRDIVTYRMYITGGVSVGERYQGDHYLPNTGSVVETCATASWMLLNQRLLELTGEPAFADVIERLLWNHLPAAQSVDGDGWRCHTPLNGWKPEGYFTGPNCCSSSGPGIVAEAPTLIYARGRDGIVVNQYVPSAAGVELASGDEVTIRQITDYPVGEKIVVELAPGRPERFTLRLRLPSWCEEPAIAVNGQPVAEELEPRAYAAIDREWEQGDRVELTLPMEPRWAAGRHGNDGLYALVRGPLVYALDTIWCDEATRQALVGDAKGNPIPGLAGVVLDPDEPPSGLKAVQTPPRALGPAYVVRIALGDRRRALARMLPFANVGVWYRSRAERRNHKGRRDAYAVWLPEAMSGRFRTVDIRRVVNVHSNARRGLFVSPAHADEVFPFARYGAYTLHGIPFEVIDPARNNGKNLLILSGGPPKATARRYPSRVTIPLGFRCRALHVLGGVGGWAHPATGDRRPAAIVRIRYDDAPTQEVRWNNGEHLADYIGKAHAPRSTHALDIGGKQLRLLRIRTNAKSRIARIEIRDTGSIVAPVIAAITAELPEE